MGRLLFEIGWVIHNEGWPKHTHREEGKMQRRSGHCKQTGQWEVWNLPPLAIKQREFTVRVSILITELGFSLFKCQLKCKKSKMVSTSSSWDVTACKLSLQINLLHSGCHRVQTMQGKNMKYIFTVNMKEHVQLCCNTKCLYTLRV